MKKFLLILVTTLLVLTTGCKKDPDPVDEYTNEEKARDGLYELMQYIYLWQSYMPTVKLSDFDNPDDLLEALRYQPRDKWSFVVNWDDWEAMMQGDFVGHGISMGLDTGKVVRIVTIYKNCDLWPKGVRRGWTVKKVNGVDIAPIFINAVSTGDWSAYYTLMGPSTAGFQNTFLFRKPDGTEVSYTSTKASFTINSVTTYSILNLTSGKTGYLCFETFIDPSEAELNEAFAYFKTNNVTDLIIDLRYNRGGSMPIAQQLASLVVDDTFTDKICYKLKHHPSISDDWDESDKFVETESPLGLDRVVFITTNESASASEVVINSLKPYIDVKLVGDRTYGKPVGMYVFGFPFATQSNPNPDYTYAFAPVSFEYVNSLDEGRFYDGIPCDVLAGDDVTRDFGDPLELSLKAAISVLEGTKAAGIPFFTVTRFTEGRQLPENLILDSRKEFRK